jgi:hypothetical protein
LQLVKVYNYFSGVKMLIFSLLTAAVVANSNQTADGKQFVYGVFTPECYANFAQNDFSDTNCLKLTFSKIVGYLIVAGAFGLKIPQIAKIIKNSSVEGINPTS